MLVLTFPLVVTIGVLGDPDWGTVISGYVGAILALALMYAVAILASAVSTDEVSSFLLGSCALFALIFLDVDALQIAALPNLIEQISLLLLLLARPIGLMSLLRVRLAYPECFFSHTNVYLHWARKLSTDGYRKASLY